MGKHSPGGGENKTIGSLHSLGPTYTANSPCRIRGKSRVRRRKRLLFPITASLNQVSYRSLDVCPSLHCRPIVARSLLLHRIGPHGVSQRAALTTAPALLVSSERSGLDRAGLFWAVLHAASSTRGRSVHQATVPSLAAWRRRMLHDGPGRAAPSRYHLRWGFRLREPYPSMRTSGIPNARGKK